MEELTGSVDSLIYRNEENGYTVLSLRKKGNETMTCVGTFPRISPGMTVRLRGRYVEHSLYGRQFSVTGYEEELPEDEDEIEKYLGSGAIKGIGHALAARIVRRFGAQTLTIMEEDPQRLSEVKGISKKKALEIGAQIQEKTTMRRLMMFMQRYGISLKLGTKIWEKYGDEAYQILQENPYRLAEEIRGIGFLTADEIASRIGIHVDSDYRICSGMLYILGQAKGEGHVYLPKEVFLARSEKLLGVSASYMDRHLMELSMEKKVKTAVSAEGESRVYLTGLYRMERNVARMLGSLSVSYPEMEEQARAAIPGIEKAVGITLDEYQREALCVAAGHGLMVLTGGPGTGKTTTIRAILHFFEQQEASIVLAAPTGRAAKRMSEATGMEAKTIHRLLEVAVLEEADEDAEEDSGRIMFQRNETEPLDAEVVIIDEMSMVDISLMHSLLLAISRGTRVILVGDENQLPSVGPGNVLGDIISSGSIPVVELKKIFRQAGESDIVVNAHKIIRGEPVVADNKSRDFFLLRRYEVQQVLGVTKALVGQKLPPYVKASPLDIQVLTPMRKGPLGVEGLNIALQAFLNPPSEDKPEWEVGDRIFRQGDKVMQTRNNYDKTWVIKGPRGFVAQEGSGVFNGDMGVLKAVDSFNHILTVEFDEGRLADYDSEDMEELELAYAITIHKSQGSEYPAVVLPLLTGPAPLMNRNLLYTAVTRAKKCVTVVGSEKTFEAMIRNEKQMHRYSALHEQIRSLCEG